jgi:predicted nucleotidyltransferase
MNNTKYSSIWKERELEEKERRNLALKKARSIAKVLKRKYHAKEVFLFGSLVWRPDFIWTRTDIDLMVKGLEGKNYFETLADVSLIAHPFHVDLIPFENAERSIKKRILREGRRLE